MQMVRYTNRCAAMLTTETSTQSDIKRSLIQEIEQTSDYVLSEVLDFLLFVRSKHSLVEVSSPVNVYESFDDDPKEKILEDLRLSLEDVKAGRVHDISELWDGINV